MMKLKQPTASDLKKIEVLKAIPKAFLRTNNIESVRGKHTIGLLPRATSTETETNPSGPSSPLEQQNREDDAEGQAEGRLDDHGGDGAVPL